MIFSGPIVTSSDEPGRWSPVRCPAGTMRSSPSAYVETRTRTGVSRGSQSAGSWPRSRSTMPVMPRAAAASRVRRYAAGDRSGSTTRSMRVWASYHSFSSTSPSRRGRPSRSSARVLSQAWWASPAISTTGTSGATASSIATVGSDVHVPRRWPKPTSGPGCATRWSRTRTTTCSGDSDPERSSRCPLAVHCARWTWWSHRPGISQRPPPSYSSIPRGFSRSCPMFWTAPCSTTTSTGPAHPGPCPSSTIRTLRSTKSATRPR